VVQHVRDHVVVANKLARGVAKLRDPAPRGGVDAGAVEQATMSLHRSTCVRTNVFRHIVLGKFFPLLTDKIFL